MKKRIKKNISVRYIPNVLNKKDQVVSYYAYSRRMTIAGYLKKAGVPVKDISVTINGFNVNNLKKRLQTGDEIVAFVMPKGPAIIPGWIGAMVMLATIAYPFYQAFTLRKAKLPSYDTSGDGLDEGSPSASWTGVKTVRAPGGRIPIIYGRRLTGGTVINEYISTDGDKSYLNSLVAIGEGPIHSVTLSRINGNAAENFPGSTVVTRLGTIDQEVIPHFEDLHDIRALNIALTKDNAYVHTTVASDVEAFEVRFAVPSGLYQQDANGGLLAWSIIYQVEYKKHEDEEYIDLGTTTISGKTQTELRRMYRVEGLDASQYDIRITRTSDNPALEPFTVGALYLSGIDEINTDDLAYPLTAIAGIRSLAVDQLSGDQPQYEFLVEGLEVLAPKVMNGEDQIDWEDYYWDPISESYKLLADDTELTWDEETYVAQFCANPIWCKYDLMTNTRYGMGDNISTSDTDLPYLLERSRYCEERVADGEGGWEKRFRLDVCIDSPQNDLDLIMELADIYRGMPFYSDAGKIKLAIEQPLSPVQLFGMGNIERGSFSQAWGSRRDVPNIVYVQYDDKDNYYQQETISVIDEVSLAAGNPKNAKTIRYHGTKLSYAIRHGRNFWKKQKYISETMRFTTGSSGFIRQCGEVIDISHDVPQWGFSGKILSGSSETSIVLDRTVTIEVAKSYALRVNFADGSYAERVVISAPGSYSTIMVEAFDAAPAEFDDYSFGELNKIVMPGIITGIRRKRLGACEIEAREYNEAIYDDTAVEIPERYLSSLSLDIPNVENLKLTEGMTLLKDGTILNIIDVWFTKPSPISYSVNRLAKVKIYLSDNGGASWEYINETSGDSLSIVKPLTDGTEYIVAAASVSAFGETNPISGSPQATLTLIGKSAPPGDVSSFVVRQSRDRIYMNWSNVTDADLRGYEIRYGASWDSGYAIAQDLKSTNHIMLTFRIGASQSYWIKAIDTSLNYSENATEAVITVENIPFTNIIQEFSEQTSWAGDKSDMEVSGDNLILSEGELSGTYETPVRDMGYVATFKIGIEELIAASGDLSPDDIPEETVEGPYGDWMPIGEEVKGAASFQIKTSDDNSTWSDYAAYVPGADYTCRYFQILMTVARSGLSIDLQVTQLNYYADLPDVDEIQDGEVAVAASGDDIVFVKTFHESPAINITILTGDGAYWKPTSLSTTGVNIKLYEDDGTVATGTFRIHIHGV